MKLERAQKIVESIAKEERSFYGDWDRAKAICTVLIEVQRWLKGERPIIIRREG